jgi:hypothetical protein
VLVVYQIQQKRVMVQIQESGLHHHFLLYGLLEVEAVVRIKNQILYGETANLVDLVVEVLMLLHLRPEVVQV